MNTALLGLLSLSAMLTAPEYEGKLLWQIGTPDNRADEFLLGPADFGAFKEDGIFYPGISDPKKSWPYVHPGPADGWAGARRHSFAMVFAINRLPKSGECRLYVDLLDSHGGSPPRLDILVNGKPLAKHDVPKGASDDTLRGRPEAGKEYRFTIKIPVNAFRQGANELVISNIQGSWVAYDWLGFTVPAGMRLGKLEDSTLIRSIEPTPMLVKADGELRQVVRVGGRRIGGKTAIQVFANGNPVSDNAIEPGDFSFEALMPRVEKESTVAVEIRSGDAQLSKQDVVMKPTRSWEVYILPHSHVDIGYTHLQTEVEKKQHDYIDQSLDIIQKTASNPPEAQWKWNTEVLWAVDSYLRAATPEKRATFFDAVKQGSIALDALYGNELTALCRPEELLELTGLARRLGAECGTTVDSAMISDVPGYTWGIVPVLAQSGVKYFDVGPNMGHRIGFTLSEWGDKPFYWASPSGKEKILCWVSGQGYSWFHSGVLRDESRVTRHLNKLMDTQYPYDIVCARYSIGGDNGPPDPGLGDYVKQWNERYAYPRLIISTTSVMCQEFEKRYGDRIPTSSGDFTPYWEDGAASSARETTINRDAAERIVQAGTLCSMLKPGAYCPKRYADAWRDVILYDEHTWGAHNSISQPESDFVKGQWAIKQAFALDADRKSRELLAKAVEPIAVAVDNAKAVMVFNTSSWQRTELVILDKTWKNPGNRVLDAKKRPVPSQRLSTGELAFLAKDVPATGAAKFFLVAGEPQVQGDVTAKDNVLSNNKLVVTLDAATGAIKAIQAKGSDKNLVDYSKHSGLNEYLYVAGRDPKDPQRNGAATIRIKEAGPLVASLVVESDAPGCNRLTREIRMVSGLDQIDLMDTLDKTNVYKPEAVHIAFPFAIPNGTLRMETPWAVVRPEQDQLPGACKNYFTVQRWVDVSNESVGVTCATIDAPLIEIGAITCDPRDVVGWIKTIEPSTTFYSYVMNNYWETNYKASQDGPTTFRYILRPHGVFDATEAARFGAQQSQPLLALPVGEGVTAPKTLVESLGTDGVVITALKPSDDGKGTIVRLYAASGHAEKVDLKLQLPGKRHMSFCDLNERAQKPIEGPFDLAPYEFVTVRIDG